jgi:hypothetical protein
MDTKPKMMTVRLWGQMPRNVDSPIRVRYDGVSPPNECVVRSLERRSRLTAWGIGRWEGDDIENNVRVRSHYVVTLGRPCPGGGLTPVCEVWFSIPR